MIFVLTFGITYRKLCNRLDAIFAGNDEKEPLPERNKHLLLFSGAVIVCVDRYTVKPV